MTFRTILYAHVTILFDISNFQRADSILNLFLIFLVENYRSKSRRLQKNEFHHEWFGGKQAEKQDIYICQGIRDIEEEVAQFSLPQTARKYLNLSAARFSIDKQSTRSINNRTKIEIASFCPGINHSIPDISHE